MKEHIDPSGVRIPGGAVGLLVDANEILPNSWNPNKMDPFMREKLMKSIQKDGFTTPILVRPYKGHLDAKWEIVDGEHRWRVAHEDLGAQKLPIIDIGDISDEQAKKITIKANSLRGEFDAVGLAEMVKSLADNEGIAAVIDELPFTSDRLTAMIDLLSVDVGASLGMKADEGGDAPKGDGSGTDDGFKAFDPTKQEFEHQCPRCGFQFNAKKE